MEGMLLGVLGVLIRIAVSLGAFTAGLRAAELRRFPFAGRWSLLARSLLAVLVVVPLAAVLLVDAIGASFEVRLGISVAVVAVGLGGPAFLGRTRAPGADLDYEIGLEAVLLALAVVYIPAAVALHGTVFHHDVRLGPWPVARVVLASALVPLALGFLAARRWPGPFTRFAPVSARFVVAVVAGVAFLLLVASGRALVALGARGWLTCLAVAGVGVVTGYLLAGPDRSSRVALAVFSTIRFPALALLLTTAIPRGQTLLPVVLAYLVAGRLLLALLEALPAARDRLSAR